MAKSYKPDLNRYLADRPYQFVTCTEAARTYGTSRAKLVCAAKQAQAIHKRHKAFVVDLAAFKAYLSAHPELIEDLRDRRYAK